MRALAGFYLAILAALLLMFLSGPLYGVIPFPLLFVGLIIQVAIGGALIAAQWLKDFR